MSWQPIETAPKDGTVIDLWMADQDGHEWREPNAYFVRNRTNEFEINGQPPRDGWWAPNYDYEGRDGFCDIPHRADSRWWQKPTHWMPLPEPPEQARDEKEDGE